MVEFRGMDSFSGPPYYTLLSMGFDDCDAFMLTVRRDGDKEVYKQNIALMMQDLRPYRLKCRHDLRWPGIEETPEVFEKGRRYDVCFYRCDMAAYYVLEAINGFFEWKYPEHPEHLCFFRRGKIWLTSCAETKLVRIENEDETDLFVLKRFCDWDHAHVLPQRESYYEDGINDVTRPEMPHEAIQRIKNEGETD